eukprot:2326755-Amphidinium_carterae.1
MRADRGEHISLLFWVANTAHCVLGLKDERCLVLEQLVGVQCYGLEADEGSSNASECEARCCSDEKCETWQFHHGCWRGTPYSCEENGSDFARDS